jgi:predicted RNase H-like HicB family nuclease
MSVEIRIAEEYNDSGYLIYADNFPGAYVRGRYEEEALAKLKNEICQYISWREDSWTEIDIKIIVGDRKKQN